MVSLSAAEYIAKFDSDNNPSVSSTFTFTSPDATVYIGSITTAGVVSWTSGATHGGGAIFVGLDGSQWSPSIANTGIITLTNIGDLDYLAVVATLVDSNSVVWIFYVDDDGQAKATTGDILPSELRYPAFRFSFTPTAATDFCFLYSVRLNLSERRRSA